MAETVLLATPRSSLARISFVDHADLLRRVAADARPLLLPNPPVVVYGRVAQQRRDVGFFSNVAPGYQYSNQLMRAQPLSADMAALLGVVNERLGATYNGMLVNLYKSGTDCIGAHADSESGVCATAGIATISIGAERKFRVRTKAEPGFRDFVTLAGHALVMKGAFQDEFTHEIPVEPKVRGWRVSITFRVHDPARELFSRTS